MSQQAAIFDDQLEETADWVIQLLDVGSDDEPTDLTGCTVEMKVWEQGNPPVLRITLTSSPEAGITLNAEEGEITLRITAAQAATLRRDGFYLVTLTWADGEKNWLLRGRLSRITEVPRV